MTAYADEVRLPDGPRLAAAACRRSPAAVPARARAVLQRPDVGRRRRAGSPRPGTRWWRSTSAGTGARSRPTAATRHAQCAADLAALCDGARAGRRPHAGGRRAVVGRQRRRWTSPPSTAASRASRCVDGGWIWLGERYPTLRGVLGRARAAADARACTLAELRRSVPRVARRLPARGRRGHSSRTSTERRRHARRPRLTREHHREILRSLWEIDPRAALRAGRRAGLLAVAVPADGDDPPGAGCASSRAAAGRVDVPLRRRRPRPARPAARPDGRRPARTGRPGRRAEGVRR